MATSLAYACSSLRRLTNLCFCAASPKLLGERRGEQGVARGVPLLKSFLPIWMADSQITIYIVSEQ